MERNESLDLGGSGPVWWHDDTPGTPAPGGGPVYTPPPLIVPGVTLTPPESGNTPQDAPTAPLQAQPQATTATTTTAAPERQAGGLGAALVILGLLWLFGGGDD